MFDMAWCMLWDSRVPESNRHSVPVIRVYLHARVYSMIMSISCWVTDQRKYQIEFYLLWFCVVFNVTFNTFQVISGRWLFAIEAMITPLPIVLAHWNRNIKPQAKKVAWYPNPVTLFWQHVNQFLRWTTLTGELQLPLWNILFDSAWNRTRDIQDKKRMLYHEATAMVYLL